LRGAIEALFRGFSHGINFVLGFVRSPAPTSGEGQEKASGAGLRIDPAQRASPAVFAAGGEVAAERWN